MDHDTLQAKDLKPLLPKMSSHCLVTFEQLPGLKINFPKSELFCYGATKDVQEYANLFGYKLGGISFRYLDIPMHHRKLLNKDWVCIKEKFQKEKKTQHWERKITPIW